MNKLFKFSLLVLLTISYHSFAQTSTAKWQSQPMLIDGSGKGWGTLPRFFNTDANVKYEFRNDSQNLYLILKAADMGTNMQLLAAGFSVKLKVKTSTPIKVGITFPVMKNIDKSALLINESGRSDKLVDKTMTNPELVPKDTALLDGFMYAKGKFSGESKDEKSICFARSKITSELVSYEFRIPLREIFGDNYNLETVCSNTFQLQVSINDLSQNNIRKMRGGSGGRGGGMRGGGMRGGGDQGGGMHGEEVGQMPGGSDEMQGELQGLMLNTSNTDRKSFNIDFKLSTGK
jgi:uncharacterized membrane protein YgcG